MPLNISKQIFIDHHAHLLRTDLLQLDALGLRQAFSESRSISLLQDHLPSSVTYIDFIDKLGTFLDVKGEDTIIKLRERMHASDYINMLFDDASIGAVIIDDGFAPTNHMSFGKFKSMCERPVFHCRRIEQAIEEAIKQADTFQQVEKLFPKILFESKFSIVSLKTIAAYRGGLDLELIERKDASKNFATVKEQCKTEQKFRISRGPLYHYLLSESFKLAGQVDVPVQVHSGFGDQDQDLRLANPSCLREVLESRQFDKTKFVLLHCYPFVTDAAYLSSIYSNVSMDISLIPFIASPAVSRSFEDALATAPASKILASTDGHSVPETYWYAAHSIRRGLTSALQSLIDRDFLTSEQSEEIASLVLHGNAKSLYKLEGLR